ncbi:MAG TPA: hypothetical protein PK344_06465 [Syntrophorhabdaceae bacterium]|nr:hypothetical protein [Syntrophorhabdaceae bacterium]HPA07265.1 hypothetical protein [Methanoregulaceae archaeon]
MHKKITALLVWIIMMMTMTAKADTTENSTIDPLIKGTPVPMTTSGETSPADITKKSIVILIQKTGDDGTAIAESLQPWIKRWKAEALSSEKVWVLQKNISFLLNLCFKVGGREIAPYDILIRIDLKSDLSDKEKQLLKSLRDMLSSDPNMHFIMFLTNNSQFIKAPDTRSSDIVMAFINRWHPTLSRQEALEYWHNQHGPLVQKIGVPAVVKSYTQIHVDLTADETLFGHDIEGLSFETISGQNKFILTCLTNPKLYILNDILLKDELQFTQTSIVFVFKTLR